MTRGRRQQQSKRLRERRISIRAIQRDAVDVTKLGRALIVLARADMEAQARAEHQKAGASKPGQPDA
jgi:hypothetical protein